MKASQRFRLRKIAVLAHRITAIDSNISQSAAWKYAWDYVRNLEAKQANRKNAPWAAPEARTKDFYGYCQS
jgi:hypothetical protein